MKRIIALMSLVTVASAFGQSTSQTSLKTKKKSFLDKINTSYYGELQSARLTQDQTVDISTNGSTLYNSLIINYDHNSKTRFTTTIRHEVTDTNRGAKADKFVEADPRFALRRQLLSNDRVTLFGGIMLEAPVSRYSNYETGDERIVRGRLTTLMIAKINDFNQFIFWGALQKTAYKFNTENYNDDPVDIIYTWMSWSTTAFSEQIKFRVDVETATAHMAGKSDIEFKAADGSERILAGLNFDVKDVNLYPYVFNNPALVKAYNQLGAGLQIFKAF